MNLVGADVRRLIILPERISVAARRLPQLIVRRVRAGLQTIWKSPGQEHRDFRPRSAPGDAALYTHLGAMPGVAQISNLLYRRASSLQVSRTSPSAPNCRSLCRLEIGDTADWKSALLALDEMPVRRRVLGRSGLEWLLSWADSSRTGLRTLLCPRTGALRFAPDPLSAFVVHLMVSSVAFEPHAVRRGGGRGSHGDVSR